MGQRVPMNSIALWNLLHFVLISSLAWGIPYRNMPTSYRQDRQSARVTSRWSTRVPLKRGLTLSVIPVGSLPYSLAVVVFERSALASLDSSKPGQELDREGRPGLFMPFVRSE